MRAVEQVPRGLRDHPQVADALIAIAVLAMALLVADPDSTHVAPLLTPLAVLVSAATCTALILRRRWPRAVLLVTTAGSVVTIGLAGGPTLLPISAVVALYTVAVRSDRRTAVLTWAATAIAVTAASLLSTTSSRFEPNVFSYVGWTGVAAALGDALRTRRAYVAAVEERAERAEQNREEEARRRVAEERLRIARELHDVVAHRIAVVNVQAGVASHLLSTEPAAAEEALGHVRQASRAVLDELSDILNVLRQPGDVVDPTAPSPGLAQLDDLVASFASAGLAIDWSLGGDPRAVGAHVDLVAYRVLEEALTNALKHGTGTAHVSVGYMPASVDLVVENPMQRQGGRGAGEQGANGAATGYGLIGMRERTAAVGGVFQAAPRPDGQFRVEATLPVHTASAP